MKNQLVLEGVDFKALVSAVCRFPAIGSVKGADTGSVMATKGRAIATTASILEARAVVPGEGDLFWTAVDRRALESYASICRDSGKVTVTVDKNMVLSHRKREVTLQVSASVKVEKPVLGEGVEIDKATAEKLAYLSYVAFDDATRIELNCVFLTGTHAIACDQKTIAKLKVRLPVEGSAVPLMLAKAIAAGDVLYIGKQTVLKSGIATYAMPSLVKAQSSFPLGKIAAYEEDEKTKVGTLVAEKFKMVIEECAAVLSALARTEIVVDLTLEGEQLSFAAQNAGVVYRMSLALSGASCERRIFRVPLASLVHVAPFMVGKVVLLMGSRSDLFLDLGDGWAFFSAWVPDKKRG